MNIEARRFLALVFIFGMMSVFSAAPKWVRITLGVSLMVVALWVGLAYDSEPHL